MYMIRKLFKMETAHVLDSSYSDECKSCHGHSYCCEVFITTDTLNEDGMVIDFKKLKEIVNPIINKFDHAFVMNKNGKNVSAFKIIIKGLVLVDYNPTAENMSRDFHNQIRKELIKFIPSLLSLKVRLHETDTGYSEYSENCYPVV